MWAGANGWQASLYTSSLTESIHYFYTQHWQQILTGTPIPAMQPTTLM
jgi:hypothetical protein